MSCLRPICHTFQQVATGGTHNQNANDGVVEMTINEPATLRVALRMQSKPEPKLEQHCPCPYPSLCPVPVPVHGLGSGRRCLAEFSGMPGGRYEA